MSGKYYIGIDCGTQSTKALICDATGDIVCMGSAANGPMLSPEPGFAEQDPTDNWDTFCRATRQAMAKFPYASTDIAAMGITGQRGTVGFMDANDGYVHNFITWADKRVYELFSGQWYRENGDILDRCSKIVSVEGWLARKLTGEYMDCSNYFPAGPTAEMALLSWPDDPKVYKDFGVPREKLLDLVPPGGKLGHITRAAAEATGLPEGIPVIGCGGDTQADMLGARVTKPGEYFATYGTSSTIATVTEGGYPMSATGAFTGCPSGLPGRFNAEGGLLQSYWIVSWLRDNFCRELIPVAAARGVSVESLLEAEAACVPAGSQGLSVFPYWGVRPAYPEGRGAMIGFRANVHERAHVFKAIVEGIAYAIRDVTECMVAELGAPVSMMVIGGGGSKGRTSMQASADILGIPCRRMHTSETCALGGAITAAVGCGDFGGFTQAAEAMTRFSDTFDPIAENVKVYDDYYQNVYKKVYPSMRDIFAHINAINGEHNDAGSML